MIFGLSNFQLLVLGAAAVLILWETRGMFPKLLQSLKKKVDVPDVKPQPEPVVVPDTRKDEIVMPDKEPSVADIVAQWEKLCEMCKVKGLDQALAELDDVFPTFIAKATRPKKEVRNED
jgi:hypothetical protein